MGRAIGITPEQITNLNNYRSDSTFSELERLVLEYADRMTQIPVEVSAALFDRLRQRFSESQLVELTSAIAWENYRARFVHALGIESEKFTEGGICALPVYATESTA